MTTHALSPTAQAHHRDSDRDSDRHRDGDRNEVTNRLLHQAAHTTGPHRQQLIDKVVLLNLRLAESIARRYTGRGLDRDDLIQVANLGLVNAAQRFDPTIGKDFISFAVPTITGEIKRHFRDHGWAIRPPRRIQELHAAITTATAHLTQTLGTTPTPTDLANHLNVDITDINEATASHECFTTASIDHRGTTGEDTPLTDTLGTPDTGYDRAEAIVALAPACRTLPTRDRRILYLRFFRGWTQQEIATDLGVTQMQISRLLTRILTHLRTQLDIPQPNKPTTTRPPTSAARNRGA